MTFFRRGALAALLLSPCLARAEMADALTVQIAANPALSAIGQRDPAAARRLAAEAAAILGLPPAGLRSAELPDETDVALLRDNPLMGAVYRHDPAAALDLLTRVKQAGGTRR